MQKIKAFKIGMIGLMIVLGSLASVMYALAYTAKREVLYTNTLKIEGQEVMFRAFYVCTSSIDRSENKYLRRNHQVDSPLSSDV
jgi:hypothetical protein